MLFRSDPFPEYWNGAPKMDGMIFKPMSADVGPSAVVSGEADMHQTSNMNPEMIKMMDDAGCSIQELWWTSIRYVFLNNERPFFKNKLVRQGLAHAIDRQGIAQNIYNGYGRVENTPYAMDQWGTPDNSRINLYEYSPERAKELFVEAGLEYKGDTLMFEGQPVKLELMYPTGNPNGEKTVLVIQQNFKDVGIDLGLTPLEMASHNARALAGDFDMGMIGNGSADPDVTWL